MDSFNPRTHTGCDFLSLVTKREDIGFNPRTHTGCDISVAALLLFDCCFNPRTHTGCDRFGHYHHTRERTFQSTHPHGVRRNCCKVICPDCQFQSTHPHGVRHQQCYDYDRLKSVSIHAPTRGATLLLSIPLLSLVCFNPRTHTGCDSPQILLFLISWVSIHAPTRGATPQTS